MSVIGTISSGIHGALLLARGRPEGIHFVEADRTAVIRSFWAIPLCLPAVVCLKLLDWIGSEIPPHVPLALGRYLLLFVIGWLAFVWVSHHLTVLLNKQSEWPRFIAIWSYCSIIENTLVALGGLPGVLGAPSIVDQAAQLITFGWALWIEWYAIRLSLQVSTVVAIGLVAVDFCIGVVMLSIGSIFG
jgi:hypothetical protein